MSEENQKFLETSVNLLEFIEKSPSCFHVVKNFSKQFKEAGFEELLEEKSWNLKNGGKYFVVRNESSIIAFTIPNSNSSNLIGDFENFQIMAAHSDSPSFKIKENPEISRNKDYVQLNVEKYGGMLCAPWFDRPLSVAGKITVRTKNGFETRLVNVDRDLLLIPSLAIHMNRDANNGQSYNVQNDMLPLFGCGIANGEFLEIIANTAEVSADDILGTDLFLYNRVPGTVWGATNEYISSAKLDDLQCAFSITKGFLNATKNQKNQKSVNMICVFDNEEVGSTTKQGADSTFLQDTLERICTICKKDEPDAYKIALAKSFMISADNAHAVHPNFPQVADPINRPIMNKGIVIKFNANQKYTTDSISGAMMKQICEMANVPYQIYTNRSDIPGGSTLGNISNSHVSLNTVDIGLPQLAMHSPYETAGIMDTEFLIKASQKYFETFIEKDRNEIIFH